MLKIIIPQDSKKINSKVFDSNFFGLYKIIDSYLNHFALPLKYENYLKRLYEICEQDLYDELENAEIVDEELVTQTIYRNYLI